MRCLALVVLLGCGGSHDPGEPPCEPDNLRVSTEDRLRSKHDLVVATHRAASRTLPAAQPIELHVRLESLDLVDHGDGTPRVSCTLGVDVGAPHAAKASGRARVDLRDSTWQAEEDCIGAVLDDVLEHRVAPLFAAR